MNGDEIPDEVLKAGGALGSASSHPYAKAVAAAARERFGAASLAENVSETPGAGLSRVMGQTEERLGSAAWCGVSGAGAPSASLWYARKGESPVAFYFNDKIRPDAAETIAGLKRAGYQVSVLSGDMEAAVCEAAQAIGISSWEAALKPQDKIERITDLQARGHKVLMVGDGLNDAPALAVASCSLSPATAASISQTASDAVFQGASLGAVAELLMVGKQARRMSLQNFAVAFGYNLIFVPLAMAGFVTPLIAAIAMSTSSIVVTANAIRLRTMWLELQA